MRRPPSSRLEVFLSASSPWRQHALDFRDRDSTMLPFALLLASTEAGARWGPKAPGAAIYTSTSPTEGSSPSTQSPRRGVLSSSMSCPCGFRSASPHCEGRLPGLMATRSRRDGLCGERHSLCRLGIRKAITQRLVLFPRNPEPMEQDR